MSLQFYYAAQSDADLHRVCLELQEEFGLPAFAFDAEDHWEYGSSGNEALRINITRTADNRTIETWIPGCPAGTNFQVILIANAEPPGFLPRLSRILAATVVRYA